MDELEKSSIKIMANIVKLRDVLCIVCLWGKLSTSKLYQASNDWVGLSFSRLLSDEKNFEKITGASATRDRF